MNAVRHVLFALGVCLVAAGRGAAQTADPPSPPVGTGPAVTWGAEVDFTSQYVWRGFRYSEGKVVWPTLWVSARGLTASLFLNYDPAWNPKWNEYDLTFTYERAVGPCTVAGTYTRYVYYEADRRDATGELIGRIGVPLGPGEIYTTHAFDVELYRGSYYLEAGYAIERELDSKSALSADASIAFWRAFIDEYTQGSDTPITDGTIGPLMLNISYTRTLGRGVSVRPHVSFVRIGDSKGRHVLDPPGVTAGVAVAIAR